MKNKFLSVLLVLLFVLSGCGVSNTVTSDGNQLQEIKSSIGSQSSQLNVSVEQSNDSNQSDISIRQSDVLVFDFGTIPAFTDKSFVVVNGNKPFFTDDDLTTEAFEEYSELDSLGRCGVAYANICKEIMPTEKRGSIGAVKPSGWHTIRYDDLINGKYLYNRCHLIGYQLAGENANPKNLITGTRYLNIVGMLEFENLVDDYVDDTGNHVLYRVTPVFMGDNLVAHGVLMEGLSVEDNGKDVCYCVFCYNKQPGIEIDYSNGDSWRASERPSIQISDQEGIELPDDIDVYGYIGNKNTKKVHIPTCSKLPSESNQVYFNTLDEAMDDGYAACGICKPQ